MCLAIPGRITDVYEEHGLRMGRVDYAGTSTSVCLAYVEEADKGDYVLVHAGFALTVLDEEEAQRTLELWDELAHAGEEDGPA